MTIDIHKTWRNISFNHIWRVGSEQEEAGFIQSFVHWEKPKIMCFNVNESRHCTFEAN